MYIYFLYFFNNILALCPPHPNELDIDVDADAKQRIEESYNDVGCLVTFLRYP